MHLTKKENHTLLFFLASTFAFAGIVGCMLGGWLSDLFGRKKIIIFSAIPFLASTILLGCSQSLPLLLLSRGIGGLGDGLMVPTVLVYIAETSSKELRSTLSNIPNISFCLGSIITYLLSMMISWRILNWVLLIPPLLTILMMLNVPETPYWLAQKNRIDEVKKALLWLRNGQEIEEEFKEISEKCKTEEKETFAEKITSNLSVLKSKMFLKPFLIAEPLIILYNCSGLTVVAFYLVSIFQESGSSIDKFQASLIVSSWRLIMSLFSSLALLKLPRRFLFISSTLITGLSLSLLGTFIFLKTKLQYLSWTDSLGWVPLALILLIYSGSQLGFNPITKVFI